MRRKRCPYCKSLDTHQAIIAKRDVNNEYSIQDFKMVCDGCDGMFEENGKPLVEKPVAEVGK